jgi:hypothetical protein
MYQNNVSSETNFCVTYLSFLECSLFMWHEGLHILLLHWTLNAEQLCITIYFSSCESCISIKWNLKLCHNIENSKPNLWGLNFRCFVIRNTEINGLKTTEGRRNIHIELLQIRDELEGLRLSIHNTDTILSQTQCVTKLPSIFKWSQVLNMGLHSNATHCTHKQLHPTFITAHPSLVLLQYSWLYLSSLWTSGKTVWLHQCRKNLE